MARPRKAAPQHVEEEDASQEIEELEATEPDEDEEEVTAADQPKMSKADAIRVALREGIESPDEATDMIRKRFGLDISKTHFSATKSQLKKKEGLGTPRGTRGPRAAEKAPASEAAPTPAPRARAASTAQQPPAPEGGMISDLAAVKALVKRLGVEQVKQIADLFED